MAQVKITAIPAPISLRASARRYLTPSERSGLKLKRTSTTSGSYPATSVKHQIARSRPVRPTGMLLRRRSTPPGTTSLGSPTQTSATTLFAERDARRAARYAAATTARQQPPVVPTKPSRPTGNTLIPRPSAATHSAATHSSRQPARLVKGSGSPVFTTHRRSAATFPTPPSAATPTAATHSPRKPARLVKGPSRPVFTTRRRCAATYSRKFVRLVMDPSKSLIEHRASLQRRSLVRSKPESRRAYREVPAPGTTIIKRAADTSRLRTSSGQSFARSSWAADRRSKNCHYIKHWHDGFTLAHSFASKLTPIADHSFDDTQPNDGTNILSLLGVPPPTIVTPATRRRRLAAWEERKEQGRRLGSWVAAMGRVEYEGRGVWAFFPY